MRGRHGTTTAMTSTMSRRHPGISASTTIWTMRWITSTSSPAILLHCITITFTFTIAFTMMTIAIARSVPTFMTTRIAAIHRHGRWRVVTVTSRWQWLLFATVVVTAATTLLIIIALILLSFSFSFSPCPRIPLPVRTSHITHGHLEHATINLVNTILLQCPQSNALRQSHKTESSRFISPPLRGDVTLQYVLLTKERSKVIE
mmetsp:Transcript_7055/g.10550  ORF Transcript_7055/g.10550 Transcript_7055/m.10550 type:complete len:203 (-) Transcript_7055:2588-3196(-)